MEYNGNWLNANKSIPLPTEDFDQYFSHYNEIDDLFNETLTGLQDLDVPSGFAHLDSKQNNNLILDASNNLPYSSTSSSSHRAQHSQSASPQSKHSRKTSGTAIFGFSEHNSEFSLNGITLDLNKSVKPSVDLSKSVMPGELLKTLNNPQTKLQQSSPSHKASNSQLDFNFSNNHFENSPKKIHLKEEDEYEDEIKEQKKLGSPLKQQPKNEDYIVTNQNPVSYKFPPSPPPPSSSQNLPPSAQSLHSNSSNRSVNSYSVKYLKELTRFNGWNSAGSKNSSGSQQQLQPPVTYVDDIEPLLNDDLYPEPIQSPFQQKSSNNNQDVLPNQSTPFKNNQSSLQPNQELKFVPIPVQNPTDFGKRNDYNSKQIPDINLKNSENLSLFLPPPSPPMLSNGSPEWQSSPEPQSPSPSRVTLNQGYYSNTSTVRSNASQFLSPPGNQNNRNSKNFYNPQYFSDSIYENEGGSSNNMAFQQQSSLQFQNQSSPAYPGSLNSSPVRFNSSPLRNVHTTNDDTVDANATITQLTPLKNQLPNTPNRSKIKLEWSPIISPNAKSSTDVRKAIQQSSPRRKIKKTSLLPPGELDQYWEGPDENKIFTCTYKNCGKKFTRRYNVRSHIQTHLSDRPFGCSYCPKKFVRQHDLNRHVKGHLEARHCQCPCGKEFARLDAMRKHRARNICSGGIANSENNCITKPQKSRKGVASPELLNEFTSDKLSDDLNSALNEHQELQQQFQPHQFQ